MSTLKVNTLEEATAGGATYFTAKAWGTFTGSASTPVMNDSGNFSSSITDSGTGLYSVTFTNSLADVNYVVTLGGVRTNSSTFTWGMRESYSLATSGFSIKTMKSDTTSADHAVVSIAVVK